MNIYGAQLGNKTDYCKIMNNQPSLGSFWKGRVLLGLSCHKKDNPKLESNDIDKDLMEKYKSLDITSWKIQAELYYGISMPKKDEKYTVQIRWADQELQFNEIKPQNGIWEFYQKKELICEFPHKETDIV